MVDLGRRDFLRILGMAGAATAATGCSEPTRKLIPYIIPPEDIIPGEANWYATTCRECPAGCGLLAKNRDGRVIKVEGNPLHPVSGGKLCARGQASLHGLYNPDRFTGPLKRNERGGFDPVSWDAGERLLVQRLKEIVAGGRGERIVFVSELVTGSMKDLIDLWVKEMGNPAGHILYEPFAYEPLRKANEIVFGYDGIPAYRIDQADFIISFGAGFLETWLSNIEYARQYAAFHTLSASGRNPFVYVGPRLSMTGNNADLWIPVAPGEEYLIGLGMLRVILDENLCANMPGETKNKLGAMASPWPLEAITARTGVDPDLIHQVARRFAGAKRPLALAEGLSLSGPHATETAVAANLLCAVHPGSQAAIDSAGRSAYSDVARADTIKELTEKMKRGEIELLLIHEANPAFSLPLSWDFRKSLESVPLVVSFSSAIDETGAFAHLVLPTHTPLESWGDYSPRAGVTGLMQPVMGTLFDTKHLGDVLIGSGKAARGGERFPWKDFHEVLQSSWTRRQQTMAPDIPFEAFWEKAVETGGVWETGIAGTAGIPVRLSPFAFPTPNEDVRPETGLHFTTYPSVLFFDGRQANRMWLQEIPDPLTMITWDGWVEIHQETAEKLGIRRGDMLLIKSPYGRLEAPAIPIPTVPAGTVAMPMGQGHTNFGRYANERPANPMLLFSSDLDPATGGILRPAFGVTLEKTGKTMSLAHVDGSFSQHGRGLMRVMAFDDYGKAIASKLEPEIDYPMPEGFDPEKDFYPAHSHKDYRWVMIVDLDRCIGCSACVVACYAENNVAVVGKEQMVKGREMSWLRIQRYFDDDKPIARWLPMLCQHCDCAPCESVCPVYAPHHSKEGLNNQVYNRCFGTRFCLQNDPYKVRRFNWFTFTRPKTLEWQLNPDVTVRGKGVMEKCSFCIQRIIEAKSKARNEGRKLVEDGEFTTACAQTCPANVFTFGNLLDPNSRASRLIQDPRAYQVLGNLNTKPAVIYLKRVTKPLEV